MGKFMNVNRSNFYLLFSIFVFSLLETTASFASDRVAVGEYKKGWNDIDFVSIRRVFYIEDYQEIVVSFSTYSAPLPEKPSAVEISLFKAREEFPDRFLSALKEEKEDLRFIRTEKQANGQNTNGIDDKENNYKSTGSPKRLMLIIKLVDFSTGTEQGFGSAVYLNDGFIYTSPNNNNGVKISIEGEIIDIESNTVLSTFRHSNSRTPSSDLVEKWKSDAILKVLINSADDIANFLGDFSR